MIIRYLPPGAGRNGAAERDRASWGKDHEVMKSSQSTVQEGQLWGKGTTGPFWVRFWGVVFRRGKRTSSLFKGIGSEFLIGRKTEEKGVFIVPRI